MFRGVNPLNLDAKGRLAVPVRYREVLRQSCDGQMVLTVDRECLLLYPLPAWEEIERKLVALPTFNPKARRMQRLLVGHATEVELDGAGRILLPQPLRQFAGLDKEVVLIGQGHRFEIWDAQLWARRREEWLTEEAEEEGELPPELESLSI